MCPFVPSITCVLVSSNFAFAITLPVDLAWNRSCVETSRSIIAIQLLKPGAQQWFYFFNLGQVELAHLPLVRGRELLIQLPCRLAGVRQLLVQLLQRAAGKDEVEVSDADTLGLQQL